MIQMTRVYSERRAVSIEEMRGFLMEDLSCPITPASEASLSNAIFRNLERKRGDYSRLRNRCEGFDHSLQENVNKAVNAINNLLRRGSEKEFLQLVANNLDVLRNNIREMRPIELFHQQYNALYEEAKCFMETEGVDFKYLEKDRRAKVYVEKMREILGNRIDYSRIAEVRECIDALKPIHEELLDKKRNEVCSVVKQCMGSIHTKAETVPVERRFVSRADSVCVAYMNRSRSLSIKTIAALVKMEDEIIEYENECSEKLTKMFED